VNILLDTNILTRWVNTEDPQHDEAVQSLRLLRAGDHIPTLVPQNIYEFWVVATRPIAVNGLGMTTGAAHAELERFAPPLFALLQDERAILSRWQELVTKYDVKGKPAHDARLAAAMLRHGLTHLLTFNVSDFSRYAEITAVTPSDMISGAGLL
jgi:predicted nucleic acid-binding protein